MMRNEQLNELSNLMTQYYNNKPQQKVVLLGDFNITPWSSYYKEFDKTMHTIGLDDITTKITATQYDSLFPNTRCHQQA